MDLEFNFDEFKNIAASVLKGVFIGIMAISLNFFFVFFPAIFLELSVENGLYKALGSLGLTSAIIMAFTSPLYGVLLFFLFAPMVLAFHYCYINKKGARFTFFAIFMVLLLSTLAFELGSVYISDFNFSSFQSNFIESQLEILKSNMAGNPAQLEYYEDTLKRAFDITFMLMPAFYIIGIALISYFSYTFTGRNLIKKGIIINQPPMFAFLSMPRNLILVFAIGLLGVVILKTAGFLNYEAVYYNLIAVFLFSLFVNGLATISFFMLRYKIVGFLKYLIYFLIIIVPIFAPITAIIGFLDMLFQFRSRKVTIIKLGSDNEKK